MLLYLEAAAQEGPPPDWEARPLRTSWQELAGGMLLKGQNSQVKGMCTN